MAYIGQQDKKVIAIAMMVALKDFPTVKYSLSIRDHSQIVCKITKGPVCLVADGKTYTQVNHHHLDKRYTGEALKIMTLINDALHTGHWDKSDSQSDYFHCAFYISIEIGAWDKPYSVV